MCDVIKCAILSACLPIVGIGYVTVWTCSPSFREKEREAKRARIEEEEETERKLEASMAKIEASLAQIKIRIDSQAGK